VSALSGIIGMLSAINRNIVRLQSEQVSAFVGIRRLDDPPPPTAREVLHEITLGPQVIDGVKLHVSSIRLFANSGVEEHGPPVYEVVVGAPGIGAI